MTSEEKKRLRLIVDGYDSFKKFSWAAWVVLLLWRTFLWLTGPGSIGDVTMFSIFVVVPIGVSGFTASATRKHRRDLRGAVVAGVSEQIDDIADGRVIVQGESYEVPQNITSKLEVGEMIAIEFAPSTRLVLAVHRIQGGGPMKQLGSEATNRSAVVTD